MDGGNTLTWFIVKKYVLSELTPPNFVLSCPAHPFPCELQFAPLKKNCTSLKVLLVAVVKVLDLL